MINVRYVHPARDGVVLLDGSLGQAQVNDLVLQNSEAQELHRKLGEALHAAGVYNVHTDYRGARVERVGYICEGRCTPWLD